MTTATRPSKGKNRAVWTAPVERQTMGPATVDLRPVIALKCPAPQWLRRWIGRLINRLFRLQIDVTVNIDEAVRQRAIERAYCPSRN